MMRDRAKILIADDESAIRDALKAILLSAEYNVVEARDGKEAIEAFKRESPDLVILDVSMPRFSGFKVLDKIKKYMKERYIPILFLTVSGKTDHKLTALRSGACDYLTKPISPEELLARIGNFLEIKREHDQLKKAALHDWMTGAINKKHFIKMAKDEMVKAVRNKTPLSIIFMDIDHFKAVNDTLGHMTGDYIIIEFASRVKKNIRNIDLFSRFGGDEFMVMLPHKALKEAGIVAKRIRDSVRQRPFVHERRKIRVTVSQGIVELPAKKNISVNRFIKLADEALYKAKARGGDAVSL